MKLFDEGGKSAIGWERGHTALVTGDKMADEYCAARVVYDGEIL